MADITQTKKLSEFPVINADDLRIGDYFPVLYVDPETGELANGIVPKEDFIRARIYSDLSLYIDATNGNDANDGVSSATAVKTWARLLEIAYNRYNYNNYNLTIVQSNLPAGTYEIDYGQLENIGAIYDSGFSSTVIFRRVNTVADYPFLPVRNLGSKTSPIDIDITASNAVYTASVSGNTTVNLNWPDMDAEDSYTIEIHLTCGATAPTITFNSTPALTWLDGQTHAMTANKTTIFVIRKQGESLCLANVGGTY